MAKSKNDLTSRERVRLALNHQETDRIPIAMVCSGINPPVDAAFDALLRRKKGIDLNTYLDDILDIRYVQPEYIGPPLPAGVDMWGVHRKEQSFGSGAYKEIDVYPLAGVKTPADLEKHPWPSPDWFDYNSLEASINQANQGEERCLMIHNANIFETAWYMRGFEQSFIDFADSPNLVHALLGRVTDFYIAYFRRLLTAAKGRVDLAFTADDIGGQDGLLLSLKMWESTIKPYHRRLNDAIHDFGVKVIYHTDGAVMKAVPGLIEMGIDVLQALQFSAKGMSPLELKQCYGDRLCFEGGVSVQTTLPFGTPAEVQAEVEMLIDTLGRNGGYILGPSHWIQAGTPAENIYAMFESAINYS
jgi:uroporphyrinogen decarboxylase